MKESKLKKLRISNWSKLFWHSLILLVMLFLALYLRIHDIKWIEQLGNYSFDSYNHIYPRQSNGEVMIVDINEESLAQPNLGQWPWSRKVIAQLVKRIHESGARVIVFDLVFAEKDRTSPHLAVRRLREEQISAIDIKDKYLPDYDSILAQEIKSAGNVVTGFIWSGDPDSTRREPALHKPFILDQKAQSLYQTVPAIRGVTTNIPVLQKSAAGNGNFGVRADIDGIIRKVPLVFSYIQDEEEQLYPSLSLEAARVAYDPKSLMRIEAPDQSELGPVEPPYRIVLRSQKIPLNQSGLFYVHYAPLDPQRYIPAYKVLENKFESEKLKDKIVFIATSAEGLKDIRSTPLDLQVPGVEVHRNIAEQIQQGHFLLRPKLVEAMEIVVIGFLGLMIILMAPFTGAGVLAVATFLLIAIMTMASLGAYQYYGILMDPVYPALCLVSLFIAGSVLSFRRVEAERRQVRNAFGLYISRDYMRELTRNPEKLKLGGQTKTLTVMFSDIRDFTSIGERFSPDEMIRLMNDFLTPMSEKIMNNKGTIDKYIGDAIMAFWNAPLDDPDHARHACLSALDMKDVLGPVNHELQIRLKEQGKSPLELKAGIGLATGSCAVGNMGSRDRFAYSALGDAVNLASRLEGLTKTYGVSILMDQTTHLNVPELATLELDRIRVAGRETPGRIYALLGRQGFSESPDFLALSQSHEEMLEYYYDLNFKSALALLAKARENARYCMTQDLTQHMDKYYDLMEQRFKAFIQRPPDSRWDGVWQTKKSQ